MYVSMGYIPPSNEPLYDTWCACEMGHMPVPKIIMGYTRVQILIKMLQVCNDCASTAHQDQPQLSDVMSFALITENEYTLVLPT